MRTLRSSLLVSFSCLAAFVAIGCSGSDGSASPDVVDSGSTSPSVDAGSTEAAADAADPDAADPDATIPPVAYPSGVVSFTKGEKGGHQEELLPDVVLGPPEGAGCCAGSTDVLSLGNGGEIVLAFDVAIVDGPGADLLVFENAFEIGGDPNSILAEPAEVAVSEDGETWTPFPCDPSSLPYAGCAGWRPVYASAERPVDPRDPGKAGGDPFDLATIGVKRARFVRIRDANKKIPAAAPTAGFDLDAVAALHFEAP